jgi:hypothetical protein
MRGGKRRRAPEPGRAQRHAAAASRCGDCPMGWLSPRIGRCQAARSCPDVAPARGRDEPPRPRLDPGRRPHRHKRRDRHQLPFRTPARARNRVLRPHSAQQQAHAASVHSCKRIPRSSLTPPAPSRQPLSLICVLRAPGSPAGYGDLPGALWQANGGDRWICDAAERLRTLGDGARGDALCCPPVRTAAVCCGAAVAGWWPAPPLRADTQTARFGPYTRFQQLCETLR